MKRLFTFLLFSAVLACAQVSHVAADCTGTSSCTTTGNATGDLEIAYAGRNASATAPSVATGWTSVGTSNINGTSTADSAVLMACKVATGANEASNTFTNATSLIIQVYRGFLSGTTATCASAILGTPVFTKSTVNTTTTTETFGTVTNGDASSWDVGFGYCSACTAGIATAPTNMANRNSITGPPGMGGHDTNGTRSSFPSANVTLTTAGRIITGVVEIKAVALAAPSFSPGTGTYGGSATVTPTIPASSSGCYTTDGTTPAATTPGTCSTGSTYTSGDLSPISTTSTLKMIATEGGFGNSSETDATYTINLFTGMLPLLGVGGIRTGNTWTTSTGWAATGQTTTQLNCTPGCPATTLTNATVAGDLLYVEDYSIATSIASVSGGGTWVTSTNCNKTQAGAGSISCAWVLSSTGGVTSITVTLAGTDSATFLHYRSYHPSSATAVAEAVPAATTSAGCSNNCTTPTVTLAGSSDLLIAAIATGDSTCGVSSPYTNFSNPALDGFADQLNSSSGTGATFTQGTSCPTAASAVAAMSTVAFK